MEKGTQKKKKIKKQGRDKVMDREEEQEREKEALTHNDLTVSKKEGSAWACC